MNIKIFIHTLNLCIFVLILSELSTSQMLTSTTSQTTTTSQTATNKFLEYIKSLFYAKETPINIKNHIITPVEKPSEKSVSIKKAPLLSRNEALHTIRQTTSKIFDPNDSEHISIHLDNLYDLTIYLDPIVDKKTITAIHFLLENQHRSSLLDAVFWIRMNKEKELDTSIPITQEVFDMPKSERLLILRKKLAIPKQSKQ